MEDLYLLSEEIIKDKLKVSSIMKENKKVEIHYVNIYSILELNLSKEKTDEVLNILKSKGIKVYGYASDEEYNYNRTFRYEFDKCKKKYDENLQIELFREYQKNRDINIRNEIVEHNLGLVPYILKNTAIEYNLDLEEISQYGYICLIEAVENFDLTKNNKFSSYACKYILFKTLNYIAKTFALGNLLENKFFCFQKAKKEAEIYFYKDFDVKDEEMLEFILNLMIKNEKLQEKEKENMKKEILINYTLSYEFIKENNYDIVSNSVTALCNRDFIWEILRKVNLTEKERKVLIVKYGLEDNINKTLTETNKEFNTSNQYINVLELSALKKLRPRLPSLEENFTDIPHFFSHKLVLDKD